MSSPLHIVRKATDVVCGCLCISHSHAGQGVVRQPPSIGHWARDRKPLGEVAAPVAALPPSWFGPSLPSSAAAAQVMALLPRSSQWGLSPLPLVMTVQGRSEWPSSQAYTVAGVILTS